MEDALFQLVENYASKVFAMYWWQLPWFSYKSSMQSKQLWVAAINLWFFDLNEFNSLNNLAVENTDSASTWGILYNQRLEESQEEIWAGNQVSKMEVNPKNRSSNHKTKSHHHIYGFRNNFWIFFFTIVINDGFYWECVEERERWWRKISNIDKHFLNRFIDV